MKDKIQKIIDEMEKHHVHCVYENCNPDRIKYGDFISELKQELSKTKKLHEIFKQNEPSKDTEMCGVVLWVNDHPVLDGMDIFDNKEMCLDFVKEKEKLRKPEGVKVNYTIIGLTKAIKDK